MTFTRNFSKGGNVGDIVAKDDSQMSVAHLLGMFLGVGLLSTISHQPWFLFSAFACISPIHFYSTFALLRATQFEVLNKTKLVLLSEEWLSTNTIPTMRQLKSKEIWFGEFIHPSFKAARIEMGNPVSEAFTNMEGLQQALKVFSEEMYLLDIVESSGSIAIVYKQDAGTQVVMKSVLHAVKLYRELLAKQPKLDKVLHDGDELMSRRNYLISSTLEWTNQQFPIFMSEINSKDWQTDAVFWGDRGNRVAAEKNE